MKRKNELAYCSYSNTIRQMPQNYMIAVRNENGMWLCDTDPASDKMLAVKVFLALFMHSVRYGSGENLLRVANRNFWSLFVGLKSDG